MTTRQIVSLFKGKRSSKGKWAARCPAHRDRAPSLIISERPNGSTGVHCFAGCDLRDVLGSVGLRVSDLFADTKPDREALKLAEKMRRQAEAQRQEQRRIERWKIDNARKWEACRNALGFLLMQNPGDDRLFSLFNHSCNMTRDLPPTGFAEPSVIQRGEFFPHHHPLDGITAQDVGRQVAAYLKLPPE